MKKSQISMFMIIGAIIFISISLVVYVGNQLHEISFDRARDEVGVGDIHGIEPLNNYLHELLRDSARRKIEEIGLRGGVFDSDHSIADHPHLSEGVKLGSIDSPYWLYLEESNGGYSYGQNKPDLEGSSDSIQDQLSNAIADDFYDRVSFEEFEHLYNVETQSKPEVDIVFTENDVVVNLFFRLEIDERGSDSQILLNEFSVRKDVPLRSMYDAGERITYIESEDSEITRRYWNLLSYYMTSNNDELLPPISHTEFLQTSPLFWHSSDVEDIINSLSSIFLPQFRVVNSYSEPVFYNRENMGDLEATLTGGFSNLFSLYLGEESFPFKIDFIHPGDIFVELNKGEQIITSEDILERDIISIMLGLGYRNYRTVYDITTPIIINMKDPDAFDGEGYTFSFPIQLNIRDNYPISEHVEPIEPPTFTERLSSFDDSRTEKNLRIVPNNPVDEDLTDTQVIYECGNDRYTLGYFDDSSTFETEAPYCAMNGKIILEKQNLIFEEKEYVNIENTGMDLLEPKVYPLKSFDVNIKKITVDDSYIYLPGKGIDQYLNDFRRFYSSDSSICNNLDFPLDSFCDSFISTGLSSDSERVFDQAGVSSSDTEEEVVSKIYDEFGDEILSNTEKTTSSLSKFDQAILLMENDFSDYVPLPPSLSFTEKENEFEAYFVPGEYEIETILISNESFTIPSECAVASRPLSDNCLFEELPEMEFDEFMLGNNEVTFELSVDDYLESDSITFYVVENKPPQNYDDLQRMASSDSQDLYSYLTIPNLS